METLIIDYYEFDPIEDQGKILSCFGYVELDYEVEEDTISYPTSDRKINSYSTIECRISARAIDTDGNVVYDDDDQDFPSLPTHITKKCYRQILDNASELIRTNAHTA